MQNSNVKDTYFQPNKSIRVGDKLLDLSTPKVMGILNITPDSFYSNSRLNSIDTALISAEKMITEGASILDIGAYSSRPGAAFIDEKEELNRLLPVLSKIVEKFPEINVSVDTFRSKVAQEVIDGGAGIINDISGLSLDENMLKVISDNQAAYILMHMRGNPQTMGQLNNYANVFVDVVSELSVKVKMLKDAGVHDIIIDPGFGFAKNVEQNHHLLRNLDAFQLFELPLLVGISRKSMIYKKLGITPEESLNGTIALNAIAINKGASILRVHDVKEAVEIIRLLS